MFQRWLKENFGRTYKDAIEAYYRILEEKKNSTKWNPKDTIEKISEWTRIYLDGGDVREVLYLQIRDYLAK